MLTAWQSNNVKAIGIRADTAYDKAIFFTESWTRNTQITDVDIKWRATGTPTSAIFHATGGSTGTYGDQIRIDNVGPIILAGSGSQKGEFSFGAVSIRGAVKSAPLDVTADLTIGNKRYAQPVRLTKTIDLQSAWAGQTLPLIEGTVKSLRITASDTRAISQLFVINSVRSGDQVSRSLSSGQSISLWSFGYIGSDFPFNDVLGSQKTISIITPANVSPGAKLTIDVEYYPPGT